MPDEAKYAIRDAIHGFIPFNDWEREIIESSEFQRLRRIRQLALTDMVYPGAMHTRFEHSLGVMHIATEMFDGIVERGRDYLRSELSFNNPGLARDRVIVRLAALLHDVGHAPFSHAAESGLMPVDGESGESLKHEAFSYHLILQRFKDVIENHPMNSNYGIKITDVAGLLQERASPSRSRLWRELISGQLDSDRADYLLRDSLHIGVSYGRFDLARIVATLTVAPDHETDDPRLGVEYGGMHAAEGLIIARYMMFTQVYFQHTRRAFDYHLTQAIRHLINVETGGARSHFLSPIDSVSLGDYVDWDDWKVLGQIQSGSGGIHGECIRNRRHWRRIHETLEVPGTEELDSFEAIIAGLNAQSIDFFRDKAENSWYKIGDKDIRVVVDPDSQRGPLVPLSQLSSVVSGLSPVEQLRIYVHPDDRSQADEIIQNLAV